MKKKIRTWEDDRRLSWQRAQAQARYLGYEFVDLDTWCRLWASEAWWLRKGRCRGTLSIVKRDFTRPYSQDNIALADNFHARRYWRYWQTNRQPTEFPPELIQRMINEKDTSPAAK